MSGLFKEFCVKSNVEIQMHDICLSYIIFNIWTLCFVFSRGAHVLMCYKALSYGLDECCCSMNCCFQYVAK